MKNPSKHYPLVQIVWHDAYANANWMDGDEFQEWKKDPKSMQVHEVGWLIESDKHKYILAHRFCEANGQYGMFQMIPKTWAKITVICKPLRK